MTLEKKKTGLGATIEMVDNNRGCVGGKSRINTIHSCNNAYLGVYHMTSSPVGFQKNARSHIGTNFWRNPADKYLTKWSHISD